jgi:undecaprenyl-diphosphatase
MEKRSDFFQPIRDALSRVDNYEWRVLIAVALILGGIWLTASVAEEVVEGDAHAVDKMLLLSLREPDDVSDPIGALWVEGMVRDFTSLGGSGLLILIVSAVSGYLLLQGKYEQAGVLLAAVIGGAFLSFLLKGIFDRPRPDLILPGNYVSNASFPSGHSLLAAATYLTLGGLLAQFQTQRRLKAFIIFLCVFIMLLVGFSRVYLGVHWPSDVLAGWTIGAIWALICWLGASWMRRGSDDSAAEKS